MIGVETTETVWVYILKGENGRHYTGMTNNPVRRMAEHANGESKSTKWIGTLSLEWMKGYSNRERAREIEVLIKKKGAGQFLKTYGGDKEPEWKKLERERKRITPAYTFRCLSGVGKWGVIYSLSSCNISKTTVT